MKQLLIITLFLVAVIGCKKEDLSQQRTGTTPITITGDWLLNTSINGHLTVSERITLSDSGLLANGTWSLTGNSLTMVRDTVTYSGVRSSNTAYGTTSPKGVFTMSKQ